MNPQNYKVEIRTIIEKSLIEWIDIYNKIENITPQQIEFETKQETPKTLSGLITAKNSIEIVESIKMQYKNIKGKRLKLLLLAFQEKELLPKERIGQRFYDCCKMEFDWEIASYQAMNGYTFNEVTDSIEFESMKQYLATLIKTN